MSASIQITHHDQLLALRAGGQVQRYHTTTPLAQRENNAEHSFGVALLCMAFWTDTSCRLLKAALLHDVTEGMTGDLPHTVKRDYAEFNRQYEIAEEIAQRALGTEAVMAALTEEERARLRVADMADAFLFGYDQYRIGNWHAGLGIMRNARNAIDRFPGVAPYWFTSWSHSLERDLHPRGL